MKKKFIIQGGPSKKYFSGSNPIPCFDDDIMMAMEFDSEQEALDRFVKEREEYHNTYFEGIEVIQILPIYIFNYYK